MRRPISWLFVVIMMSSVGCAKISERTLVRHFDQASVAERALIDATVAVHARDANGTVKYACQAVAFERADGLTRFVTTASCVATDDIKNRRAVAKPLDWLIRLNCGDIIAFTPAQLVAAGFRGAQNDFGVLQAEMPKGCGTGLVPVAIADPTLGEEFAGATRNELGARLFHGYFSANSPDPKLPAGVLKATADNTESSQSPLMSRRSFSLIAFPLSDRVGYYLPASRFRTFWQRVVDRQKNPLRPLEVTDDVYLKVE